MAGTSGSNFPFSICWPLDHVLLVQRTSSSPASRRTPAAPCWWGGHDHPHALLYVYLTHAAFTHSAVGLKLRDEFEAVSERQSQTQGEIVMHSSRTPWAYSFCNTLCMCVFVCVCCLSTSVTASQPPLPEAAVPHHAFTSVVLVLPFSPPLSVSATWLRFLDHSSFLFVFLSYFPPFILHFLLSIATTRPASPERSTGPSLADKVFSCRNPQASR